MNDRLRKICLAILGIIVSIIGVTAQANAQNKRNKVDTNYIREMPHQITGRVFIGEKISIFNLIDHKADEKLSYRPNNILAIGLGTTIKGIGLNFSTRLPFHGTKEDKYGKTTRYDFQMHRYRAMSAVDIYLQRYQGFHLNDKDHVDSVVGETTYPYLANLTTLTVGASAMYIFNGRHFSMRGGVNQQDWQLRNAGSFMLGGSFFARYIFNDGSIFPPYLKYKDFYSGNNVHEISNYGLNVKVGYGYNYVYRVHYFVTASVEAGAGPGYTVVQDVNDNEQKGWGLNLAATARLSAGYNSEKWCTGFYFIAQGERYSLPYEKSAASASQGIFRVFVARRFFHKKF